MWPLPCHDRLPPTLSYTIMERALEDFLCSAFQNRLSVMVPASTWKQLQPLPRAPLTLCVCVCICVWRGWGLCFVPSDCLLCGLSLLSVQTLSMEAFAGSGQTYYPRSFSIGVFGRRRWVGEVRPTQAQSTDTHTNSNTEKHLKLSKNGFLYRLLCLVHFS